MANLLQSAQTQATQAPSYFTDYLTNIAQKGTQAACQAQYVGAQPLQTKAFETAEKNLAAQQPTFEQGKALLGQAGGQDITGAVAPYLQAGTTASPLCAARPLICQSAGLNLACMAGQYMSPYLQKAVQSLSDIGQRNIQQNISPMATAAAVGSGQFGSSGGARVLGQLEAQANQDLNSQIAQMLNQGYGMALCAAKSKQGALAQLAQTTSAAQQAQNTANLQAASTAGCAAAREAGVQQQAGAGLGTLAQQASGVNLACINALATLGGQQQTIGQNEQMFPLTKLSSLASLLSGYNVPTTTKTTLCMSPLSGLAAVGSGLLGLVTPAAGAKETPLDIIKQAWGKLTGPSGNASAGTYSPTYNQDASGIYVPSDTSYGELVPPTESPPEYPNYSEAPIERPWWEEGCAAGGSVQGRAIGGAIGCGSMMGMGAAPAGLCYAACLTCEPFDRRGVMESGTVFGCSSTQNLGGLPNMG